jgi:hypothetical protein
MPHPTIDLSGLFAFEPLFLADEEGRPIVIPIVKASYKIKPDGELSELDEPMPINIAGELYGPAESSSYKYEPECAFTKPATDVILIGHAYALSSNTTELLVRLRLGRLDKALRVTGDRFWIRSLGTISMTAPLPFESMSLTYERAFGGWDRSHPDPDKHTFEPRNSVGTGFRSKQGRFEENVRLPNVEAPDQCVGAYGDTVMPAGFGFVSSNWRPRVDYAGTYDEEWRERRMPLLPRNFDRRYFNSASTGLVAAGYLKGDEAVSVENASPRGRLSFNLPGVPPPKCNIEVRGHGELRVEMNLDTIIINTDDDLLLMIWRGHLPVKNGPHDVVSIRVRHENLPSRMPIR